MSTTSSSEEGLVLVLDEPEQIEHKFKRAVTDSGEGVFRAPEKPGITNLIDILAAVRGVTPAEIEREFSGVRYGDFKAAVASTVIDYLAPVKERYGELRADHAALESILAAGAERARTIASVTLADVRGAMGVGPPR
jgi:tryptophanyl-tRNA synthetase